MLTTDANYWEQRYQDNNSPWNIGMAAPPFTGLLTSANAPTVGKTAILGCGSGHDALLFAKYGFETIGFDFAPSAIALAQNLSKTMDITSQFLQRDIFELPQEFANKFDYVIEHTCFCAIHPSQRPDYVNTVSSILKPNGELIAIFFAHNRPDGPPFGATLEEIHDLFSPVFDTSDITSAHKSIASRQGEEYLARFRVLK
jgi:SAM-dependent methyltransferase